MTVADDWQGKGLGRAVLDRLCDAAQDAGYLALYGNILEENQAMLDVSRALGFEEAGREGGTVSMMRKLDSRVAKRPTSI